ncbi:MAG: hypothetical protein HN712_00905, partial [Gemmatimonadetes bacterium]|nr:hypothetical protein [Gemmatimonadota bacterium]
STSGDCCPGHAGGIDWAVASVGAVYPEAEQFHRHLIFLRPDVCVLIDEVKAKEPESVELNFNCLGRLSRSGDLFQSTTDSNRLLIHPQSKHELEFRTNEWQTSVANTPSDRLVVSRFQPHRDCTFLTTLAPHPLDGETPSIESLKLEAGLGVRIRRRDVRIRRRDVRIRRRDEEVIVLVRETVAGTMSAEGVTTDARIAVIRRVGALVTGAAMLDGTHLATAGGDNLLPSVEPGLTGGVLVDGAWKTH